MHLTACVVSLGHGLIQAKLPIYILLHILLSEINPKIPFTIRTCILIEETLLITPLVGMFIIHPLKLTLVRMIQQLPLMHLRFVFYIKIILYEVIMRLRSIMMKDGTCILLLIVVCTMWMGRIIFIPI